ncbi:MAG: hypothetical protein U0931_41705 [Vulcanimicrobiota bacterium]
MRRSLVLALLAVTGLAIWSAWKTSGRGEEPFPDLGWLQGQWHNSCLASDSLHWDRVSPTRTLGVHQLGQGLESWLVESGPVGCRLRVQDLQSSSKQARVYEAVENGPSWVRFACREHGFPRSIEVHYFRGRLSSHLLMKLVGPTLAGPRGQTLDYELAD